MSQFTEGRTKTFQASAAIGQYLRVKLDANGKLELAGASDTDSIGTMARAALAADEWVALHMRASQGTQIMVAAGDFVKGAAVYAAAAGKIDDTGTVLAGEALEAAGADGDHVEVMPSTTAVLGAIARSAITQEDLQPYAIPLDHLKTWDDFATDLPGTAANDDLAVIEGTLGAAAPQIQSSDSGGTTVTQYLRFQFAVPVEYVDGQTITLRVLASMQVVSDTMATLDAEVYRQAAPTVDVCATAAQSINSATPANKDFTITPTAVVSGDILDVRLTVAIDDSGNAADYIQAILETITMLLDVKA